MDTSNKAKELLSEIDKQIGEAEKNLKQLKATRKEIVKVASRLRGVSRDGRSIRRAAPKAGRRVRTDWNKVISKFQGSFTLDDLAKASGKAKPTVNQAVQVLKKAKKIVPTGKRGVYKKVGNATKK